MATITIEAPDYLLAQLGESPEARSRFALEAIAIEAYRQRRLGTRRLADLLAVSHVALLEFLQKRGVPSNIPAEDVLQGYNAGGRFLRS